LEWKPNVIVAVLNTFYTSTDTNCDRLAPDWPQ